MEKKPLHYSCAKSHAKIKKKTLPSCSSSHALIILLHLPCPATPPPLSATTTTTHPVGFGRAGEAALGEGEEPAEGQHRGEQGKDA